MPFIIHEQTGVVRSSAQHRKVLYWDNKHLVSVPIQKVGHRLFDDSLVHHLD